MEVSGQHHAPAVVLPWDSPRYPLGERYAPARTGNRTTAAWPVAIRFTYVLIKMWASLKVVVTGPIWIKTRSSQQHLVQNSRSKFSRDLFSGLRTKKCFVCSEHHSKCGYSETRMITLPATTRCGTRRQFKPLLASVCLMQDKSRSLWLFSAHS